MLKATVLGAGYMGSAITFPLSENNMEVCLWGTWLDDHLVKASIEGSHPKLKKPLNENIDIKYSQDIKDAVKDADIIFIGIASEGFVDVLELLFKTIEKNCFYFKLTKGLVEYKGKTMRATEAANDMFAKKFPGEKFLWASVGGPVKAVDLAHHTPSGSVYGISDSLIKDMIKSIETDYYRIFPTEDLVGVEVCSTFKNIYSIASGLCDGLYKTEKEGLYHNLVAFLFNQGCLEIAEVVEFTGGKKETAFDLGGMGDLHVTSAAGRNRRLGELIGNGNDPEKVFKQMYDEGEYGEGYVALGLAVPWLKQKDPGIIKELPLLQTLNNIIFNKSNPAEEIKKLVSRLGY
jgi:glycerol-3-phosphate dehydrogenase (NAD(P)+)